MWAEVAGWCWRWYSGNPPLAGAAIPFFCASSDAHTRPRDASSTGRRVFQHFTFGLLLLPPNPCAWLLRSGTRKIWLSEDLMFWRSDILRS